MAGSGGGGETAKDVSAWTPDLIRSLIAEADKRYEQRFVAQEKAVQDALLSAEKAVAAALAAAEKAVSAALASQEKATTKYEADVERWRAVNNEWRQAMLDRENKFIQTDTYEARQSGVDARLSSLEKSRDQGTGRSAAFGVALVVIFSLITLALRFIPG